MRPDEPAQDVELAMEEMVRAGDNHYRQVLRPGPVEHRGERHGLVVLAMEHERAGLYRWQRKPRDRNADEDQLFRLDPLREHHLDAGAEGKAGERQPLGLEVRDDRRQVFQLAASLVVRALGLADAAEVRPPCLVTELDEGPRERLHHLVVECAAEERMRMRDQRHAYGRRALGPVDRALDAADRAGDEFPAGARPHIFKRSTTRPCWTG